MVTDMKESGKTTNTMIKVKKIFILTLFNALKGNFFWNDGDRYEGEWIDNKRNGQGKKSYLLNHLLILT